MIPTRLALLFGLAFVAVGFTGCRRAQSTVKPADVDYYTCTMHPSVRSQDPKGKCPICSMDLVPVKKRTARQNIDEHAGPDHSAMSAPKPGDQGMAGMQMPAGPGEKMSDEEKPREFTVPLDRQQLIGVTFAKVEKTPLKTTVRAVGMVAADKLRHWDYVSRVEGYVQKLLVSSRGERVRKGQPLLTIYSPDLLAAQREFIEALRIRDEARQSNVAENTASADRLAAAARRRLALWNLGEPQLEELEKSRHAQDTLTLSSPFDGVVLNLRTNQGSRVMPGDHLVDVADLSVVWVWAEFYQEELPLVRVGSSVSISTSAYPNEKRTGKIALIDPFLNEAKRTGRVRIDLDNADMKLRPDMYVNVELELDFGEQTAVPVSAVLPTGERNIVFLDKGEGRLEPRFIQVGRKVGDHYVVLKGLVEGDRIVTSANFLIDAEAKVQGALKSW